MVWCGMGWDGMGLDEMGWYSIRCTSLEGDTSLLGVKCCGLVSVG